MKKILVLGATGFLGSNMLKALIKTNDFIVAGSRSPSNCVAHESHFVDLRCEDHVEEIMELYEYDEVYQFAGEVGGSKYITENHNKFYSTVNNVIMTMNLLQHEKQFKKIFFPSSSWVYPAYRSQSVTEDDVYPIACSSTHGWEKLLCEIAYKSTNKAVIGRLNNVYGPGSQFKGARALAPAAACYNVIMADKEVEVWGDGTQSREFMYVDDCIKYIIKLMRSDCNEVVNISGTKQVNINELTEIAIRLSGKDLKVKYVDHPIALKSRSINTDRLRRLTGISSGVSIEAGMSSTYDYVKRMMHDNH